MGKKLVIVESPAKARTIGKILGRDYAVASSVGHVRDLPVKNLGVDVENGFAPQYTVMKGKKKVVDELKKAVKNVESVYLAPDPDREGEAIAWHLRELLRDPKKDMPFWRVQYNEVTPQAVKAAFQKAGDLNMPRVNAQQARRVLDRLVGYKVSPLLWRQIGRGLSAGRVQSVALRILCERERQIEQFVPEEYWVMGAKVRKNTPPPDPFTIRLVRINDKKPNLANQAAADAVTAELERAALRVTDVATSQTRKNPYPPLITSSMQQAASSLFGYAPQRTMSLAQKLYEGVDLGEGPLGLITYMRTDSFAVAPQAVEACRALIQESFGAEYCPEKPRAFKNKAAAQAAHEAVRPTDPHRTPDQLRHVLNGPELKLYDLIWRRFVASQMSAAVIDQKRVTVEAFATGNEPLRNAYRFQTAASEIKFPGYMKVTGAEERKNAKDEEAALPPLEPQESLECLEWLKERKETQPPRRFSEAALIRAMEGNGVGRPSTYAQIMSTLDQREYVEKENRVLRPTALGRQVNDLLVGTLGELFDVKFTAAMEASLDRIEQGELGWVDMLDNFYRRFSEWLDKAKPPPADAQTVRRMLDVLRQHVREWYPEEQRGKKVYGDRRFVESVRQQLEEGQKEISQKQLEALVRMAVRYANQAPAIGEALHAIGRADILAAPEAQPPRPSSLRKLEALAAVALSESAEKFVSSLHQQVRRGRRLSAAQVKALDNILMAHADRIAGFEERKSEFDIADVECVEDNESGPLLEALKSVREWKPPVQRGKREFDDRKFHQSLAEQFASRRSLSDRQRAALKRLVARYKEQIPAFETLAEQFDIKPPSRKKSAGKGGRKKSAPNGA